MYQGKYRHTLHIPLSQIHILHIKSLWFSKDYDKHRNTKNNTGGKYETELKKLLARQNDKVGVGYDANVGVLRVSRK